MTRIEGFHGRADDLHPRQVRDLYVAGREHAQERADRALFRVTYDARSALEFTRAEHFHAAWQASRAHEVRGRFHPDTTRVFTDWARAQGHDAVVLHPAMFTDEEASHEHWETAVGTFGDPQSIILNPRRAQARRVE